MVKYHNCYVNIDDRDVVQVIAALQEDSISGKGKFVNLFEKKLSTFFEANFALSCCNATLGIYMILLLENIGPGDEVILPPTAPVMSVLPILAVGATPIFVDNENRCFNVDINDLNQKITSNTKLFINVPMWGYANNIDKIVEVCANKNIKVLEDNSHCHGTKFFGQHLGTFGNYAVYSTHERKLITTGEGGFLLIKSKSDYEKLSEIRSFGEIARSDSEYQSIKGSYGYFFGLNFKLSSINAALGISQVDKLLEKIAIRKKNAAYLIENLNLLKTDIKELSPIAGSDNNYYSIVLITNPERKNEIEQKLATNDIISDPMRYQYKPLYKMSLFEQYNSFCPNAEELTKSIFTLPVHEGLTKDDLDIFLNIISVI